MNAVTMHYVAPGGKWRLLPWLAVVLAAALILAWLSIVGFLFSQIL